MFITENTCSWNGGSFSQVKEYVLYWTNYRLVVFFYRRIEGPVVIKGHKATNAYQVIRKFKKII
jgi:hypothetical protein